MKKFSLILAVALALCLAVMPSLAANAFPAASGSYSNSGAIQGSNIDYEVAKDGSSVEFTAGATGGYVDLNIATGYIGNWAGHRNNKYIAFKLENKKDTPLVFMFNINLVASGAKAQDDVVVKDLYAYNADMTENLDVTFREADASGMSRQGVRTEITVPAKFNGWILIPNTAVDIDGFINQSEDGALELVENATWNEMGIAADSEYHINMMTMAFSADSHLVLGDIVASTEDIPDFAKASEPEPEKPGDEGDFGTLAYLAVAACSAGALVISRKRK